MATIAPYSSRVLGHNRSLTEVRNFVVNDTSEFRLKESLEKYIKK